MLELRLRTLDSVVDVFVAVEANVTHQGEPRAHALKVGDLRFDKWYPKLLLHAATGAPTLDGTHAGRFAIERWHRDQMRVAADVAATLDSADVDEPVIVLTSDVDEIPDPAKINAWTLTEQMNLGENRQDWLVMEQRFHSTAFDLLHPNGIWLGTCVSFLGNCSPQAQRDDREAAFKSGRFIADAGWHFSWFGSDEERQRKLDTFSHSELRDTFKPEIARHARRHANGEELRHLNGLEVCKLSWPEPLRSGEWIPPDGWWS